MTAQQTDISTTEFLSNLNDECAALRAFVVLLEDEQRCLLGQRTEELLPLAEAKVQLTNKIAALAEARQRFLPPGTNDMAGWLKRNVPQGLTAWQETRQLATQVYRLNQTNGELIQIKLRYNQQALGVLYGAAQGTAGLYGADGQPNQPSASRMLGSV
ncbi:flagella synthesis protein FlgN [Sideroxydans lithotrophicus]|uniref:FlgN family protein n=1 Tax=Sideroxydans lithotrophicus (strain ES-1) TaxID=580332 RepID=D5CMW6_SIDLE|nr:flagellar protein FlgN [Sideroxydans lithotrophicus]ADE10802.1 FlgN family protein [Sideroxydans lithotrophicus ES-1]